MKRILAIFLLLVSYNLFSQEVPKPEKLKPEKVTDTYYGMEVEDDYRYVEDLQDPKVLNWMKANAKYARSILDEIPGRADMLKGMKEMDARRAAGISQVTITEDDTYYYLKQRPEDETGKLFYRKGYDGEEKLLLDPEKYKSDSGQNYIINAVVPNEDGDEIAVRLAPNGSETWEVIFLKQDGKKSGETLNLSTGPIFWIGEDKISYNQLGSADVSDISRQLNMKSYIHKLGTDQKEDKVGFSNSTNPELNIQEQEIPFIIYDDVNKNIYGMAVTVDKSLRIFKPASNDLPSKWTEIVKKSDMINDLAAPNEDYLYLMSFKNAPNFKILRLDAENPDLSKAEVAVPEPEEGPITQMYATEDGLYYSTIKNGIESKLYFLGNDAKEPKELKLPFAAGSLSISGKNPESGELWVSLSGWTNPTKRYRYDLKNDKFISEPLSSEVEYPELKDLEVKEIEIPSYDGTMVPVSIVSKKGIKMDGSNPTAIYGYGSYGAITGPFFSPVILSYTNYGGIFVVPHVRGGGELGDAWHRAGQKENKPNTWKDAIATAKYLIDKGYTNPKKLSIMGGSAGGIFVGRSVTERPDLFVAAAPIVGEMNTVRSEETPNGPVNAPEFGTVKDEAEFKALLEMDSYHALKKGVDYPAMLITAGMNDPRVIAWQPAKFAAKAQEYNTSDDPILFLTDFESGHGIGDDKTKQMERFADIFSFFYWQSGDPKFQPNDKLKN